MVIPSTDNTLPPSEADLRSDFQLDSGAAEFLKVLGSEIPVPLPSANDLTRLPTPNAEPGPFDDLEIELLDEPFEVPDPFDFNANPETVGPADPKRPREGGFGELRLPQTKNMTHEERVAYIEAYDAEYAKVYDEVYDIAYDGAYAEAYDVAYNRFIEAGVTPDNAENAAEDVAENRAEDRAEDVAEDRAEDAAENAGERAVERLGTDGPEIVPFEGELPTLEPILNPFTPPEIEELPNPDLDLSLDVNGDGVVDEFEEYGLPPIPTENLDSFVPEASKGYWVYEFENGHRMSEHEYRDMMGIPTPLMTTHVFLNGDAKTTRQELELLKAEERIENVEPVDLSGVAPGDSTVTFPSMKDFSLPEGDASDFFPDAEILEISSPDEEAQ